MRKIFLLCFFFLLTQGLSAQMVKKYSNEFLSLGLGARGLAMGNSMTAITDDVSAAFWNPAGLSRMNKKYQLGLMHAEYFAGIAKYDYAGIGYKVNDRSTVAFSYIRFGVDNIMNTTELIDQQGNLDYDKIVPFSAIDNAFFLSYAHQLEKIDGFSIGGNAKIIHRKIGSFAGAWGFGLDFGLQYHKKGWQAGLMAKDVTSTFNAWKYTLTEKVIRVFQETQNEIPENGLEITLHKIMIGGAKRVEFGKGFNGTFSLDLDFTFDGKRNTLVRSDVVSMDPHFGMEFAYKNIVALRAGIGNFQQETDFDKKKRTSMQINLGLGVSIKEILTLDYAFTNIGDLSIAIYSHIFSIKVGIDSFTKKNRIDPL